jgi:hypothetical protein
VLYPNPYNPSTGQPLTLSVNINQNYDKATLKLYTSGYRLVKKIILLDEAAPAGERVFSVNAWHLSKLSSGTYYYLVEAVTDMDKIIKSKASYLIILR